MDREYRVKITPLALGQLVAIKEYIANILLAPQTADRILTLLESEILSLTWMPARCPLIEERRWQKHGVRKLLVRKYIVYYWIDESVSVVYVVAVLYSGRDQKKHLQNIVMK